MVSEEATRKHERLSLLFRHETAAAVAIPTIAYPRGAHFSVVEGESAGCKAIVALHLIWERRIDTG
jgi:hypothetical protein